jgi:hypothetical protein
MRNPRMSHRVKLAREIAACTEPRFIGIKPEPRTKLRRTNDWLFIEIGRERGKESPVALAAYQDWVG